MRGFALIASTLCFCASPALAQEIAVLYNARPPYAVESGGGVTGLIGDPVTAAFKKAGVPFKWEASPINRQLSQIKEGTAPVCGAGWYRNAEREAYAQFTESVYQGKPHLILTRKDSAAAGHRTIDALLADAKIIVLTKGGLSYGAFIDEKLAKAASEKSVTTQENIGMASMIAAGRADLMFMAGEEGEELLKAPELADKGLILSQLDGMPPAGKRHLMCSRSVPAAVIEALNRAIATP
jgi:polar amino acid transport system substrate-binding protein